MILYTLGHSNLPAEVFLELLQRNRIEVLVDCRSKTAPNSPASPGASSWSSCLLSCWASTTGTSRSSRQSVSLYLPLDPAIRDEPDRGDQAVKGARHPGVEECRSDGKRIDDQRDPFLEVAA